MFTSHSDGGRLIILEALGIRNSAIREHWVRDLAAKASGQARPEILEGLGITVDHIERVVPGARTARSPETELGVQIRRSPAVKGKVVRATARERKLRAWERFVDKAVQP